MFQGLSFLCWTCFFCLFPVLVIGTNLQLNAKSLMKKEVSYRIYWFKMWKRKQVITEKWHGNNFYRPTGLKLQQLLYKHGFLYARTAVLGVMLADFCTVKNMIRNAWKSHLNQSPRSACSTVQSDYNQNCPLSNSSVFSDCACKMWMSWSDCTHVDREFRFPDTACGDFFLSHCGPYAFKLHLHLFYRVVSYLQIRKGIQILASHFSMKTYVRRFCM